jgi:hypothetical protein
MTEMYKVGLMVMVSTKILKHSASEGVHPAAWNPKNLELGMRWEEKTIYLILLEPLEDEQASLCISTPGKYFHTWIYLSPGIH